MKTNTQYTLAVLIVAIIIIIPFTYGMLKGLPQTQPSPTSTSTVLTATSTTSTSSQPVSTVSPAHPIKPSGTYPYIQYLTPASGQVGSTVTLSGTGFAPTNNNIIFGSAVVSDINSTQNGTVLSFVVPSEVAPHCAEGMMCAQYMQEITPGTYDVSVQTPQATSNTFSFNVVAPPANQPTISSLSPASGAVGTPVTIYGTGFLPTNTVLFDGGPVNISTVAKNGTALTFTIPNSVGADCKANDACPMYARLVSNGANTVSVRNVNGTSNTVDFNVTGGTMVVPN